MDPTSTATYRRVTASYTDARGTGKTATTTLRRPIETHSKTLKFEASSTQGYVCGERPHPPIQVTTFCVYVARNQTPGSTIYYPANPSYGPNSYPNQRDISYSLAGRNASSFSMNPSSKELIATEMSGYNSPGAGGYYEVEITATDLAGKEATITIRATPSGSSDNPRVEGPRVIRYPENSTWQLATYTAHFNDPRQTVGWIIAVEPGGGDGDSFDIDDDGVLSFTQPPDFEQEKQTFNFSLHAYASNGPRGATYYGVRVIVEDVNDLPEIDGPNDVDFPENSTNDVASYTVEGLDAGDTVSWKPLSGTDASKFSLTSAGNNSAKLRFNSPPDYESFNIANDEHIFLLTLMVDVDGEMKTEHVRVEVTDVNEPPEFDEGTTATRNVGENAGPNEDVGAPVEATDPEDDALNYNLTGTDDDASFEIGLWDGQLRTISGVNYGDKSTYTVTVSVTDLADAEDASDETADDTITVTITTNEENDAPVFDDTDLDTTLEVSENTAAATNIGAPITATDEDNPSLTYTLEGDDKDSFTIVSASGQIQTKSGVTYNYEDPGDADTDNEYLVTVKASDGTASDTIDVTINVNDVNETPTFPSTETGARSVAENTPSSQAIGAPVAATDPDNEKTPNTQTLTYTLGGTDAASFDIDTSSGQLLTKDALDHDTKATYTVAVSVRDSKDDSGNDDMADDDTIAVTITVTGENEPPEFAAETDTRNIAENTDSGQDIGLPVAATDPDNGDTLTYTLDTTSDAVFDIDDLGQLKTEAALDFEAKDGYTVTVTATDGSGDTDTIDVTIDRHQR